MPHQLVLRQDRPRPRPRRRRAPGCMSERPTCRQQGVLGGGIGPASFPVSTPKKASRSVPACWRSRGAWAQKQDQPARFPGRATPFRALRAARATNSSSASEVRLTLSLASASRTRRATSIARFVLVAQGTWPRRLGLLRRLAQRGLRPSSPRLDQEEARRRDSRYPRRVAFLKVAIGGRAARRRRDLRVRPQAHARRAPISDWARWSASEPARRRRSTSCSVSRETSNGSSGPLGARTAARILASLVHPAPARGHKSKHGPHQPLGWSALGEPVDIGFAADDHASAASPRLRVWPGWRKTKTARST